MSPRAHGRLAGMRDRTAQAPPGDGQQCRAGESSSERLVGQSQPVDAARHVSLRPAEEELSGDGGRSPRKESSIGPDGEVSATDFRAALEGAMGEESRARSKVQTKSAKSESSTDNSAPKERRKSSATGRRLTFQPSVESLQNKDHHIKRWNTMSHLCQEDAHGQLATGEFRGECEALDSIVNDRGIVITRLVIYYVGAIDPLAQAFSAEVKLEMKWHEPSLAARSEAMKEHDTEELSADEVSTPAYFWENAVAVQPVNTAPTIELMKKPAGCVHFEQRVRGTFSGSFELSQFPYDVQNLCITLRITSSQDTKLNRRFVFNKGKGPVFVKSQVALAEWYIYRPAAENTTSSAGKPLFQAHLIVRRQHHFFTCNFIGMVSTICTLGFTTHVIPPDEFGSRGEILLNLLLTAVAFKFVFADSLPNIAYETKLDVHINIGFAILATICIENCGITYIKDEPLRERIDYYLYAVIGGVWLLWHCIFGFAAWRCFPVTNFSFLRTVCPPLPLTADRPPHTLSRYVARCKAILGIPLQEDLGIGVTGVSMISMFDFFSMGCSITYTGTGATRQNLPWYLRVLPRRRTSADSIRKELQDKAARSPSVRQIRF